MIENAEERESPAQSTYDDTHQNVAEVKAGASNAPDPPPTYRPASAGPTEDFKSDQDIPMQVMGR